MRTALCSVGGGAGLTVVGTLVLVFEGVDAVGNGCVTRTTFCVFVVAGMLEVGCALVTTGGDTMVVVPGLMTVPV